MHRFLSKFYLCSRHGAEEHKSFLDREGLQRLAMGSGGDLRTYKRFLFGLNQLFVIDY